MSGNAFTANVKPGGLTNSTQIRILLCTLVAYAAHPPKKEELEQVFRLVNNYLDPGGIFVFDFNTEYKYREVLGDRTIAENREEGSFIWENYYDPEEKLNEYDLTLYIKEEDGRYKRFEETHFQRAYEAEAVKGLLEKAGFQVEKMLDAETGGELRRETERLFVAARKRADG